MKKIYLLFTLIFSQLFISCLSNNSEPQKVYVTTGSCSSCSGAGYFIKTCEHCDGSGEQYSNYDEGTGDIVTCIDCVDILSHEAKYKEEGAEIGQIAVDCSLCNGTGHIN